MRRIPRGSRALDAPLLCPSPARTRTSPCSLSSPCPPCPPRRAFSATPVPAFLLPAGKQDKKKHQQFVRRWQKRLLGDSEPIGAHVDPYDPTSPVRIAPEDQGEYEEVLDDADPHYTPAQTQAGLMHVGGEQWLERKREQAMAREYEKLVARTYTPLSLDMARDVEELGGSLYTLRDDNLAVGALIHDVTGRPYTALNYGVHKKPTTSDQLRRRFAQAVAEVYTLSHAGLDTDLAQLANRGVYRQPAWVKHIKLYRTESGGLALAFPQYTSAEHFIRLIQSTPSLDTTAAAEEDELLADEGAEILEPEASAAPPVMDPDTPAFKRAAVVKQDPDRKPFDFMSNRPVPRAKPVETPTVTEVAEKAAAEAVDKVVQTIEDVSEQPPKVVATVTVEAPASDASPHADLEARAQKVADDILAIRKSLRPASKTSSAPEVDEVKWRHATIADDKLKFALYKRIHQLTSLRISDPHLTSTRTLGDLYAHFCDAAKPRPHSIFSNLHVEGQKSREQAKRTVLSTSSQVEQAVSRRKRADLGDLLTLGNVELRRTKPNAVERRKKTGLHKVVKHALWEKKLLAGQLQDGDVIQKSVRGVVEGTRAVPEFGKVVSGEGARLLAKKTRALGAVE